MHSKTGKETQFPCKQPARKLEEVFFESSLRSSIGFNLFCGFGTIKIKFSKVFFSVLYMN